MRKLSTLTFALLLTLPWLAGCNSGDQNPTKESTLTSSNDGLNTIHNIRPAPIGGNTNSYPGNQSTSVSPIGGTEGPPNRTTTLSSDFNVDNPPADMILVTVHFDFDSFSIKAEDRPLLEAAAKTLAADPSIQVVAVGHCDHYGSEQYNLALGDRRSNPVKSYLARLGASEAQVETLSRGKFGAVPDVKKDSPEAIHDRRVDVVKIPKGATLPTAPPTTPTGTVEPVAGIPQ